MISITSDCASARTSTPSSTPWRASPTARPGGVGIARRGALSKPPASSGGRRGFAWRWGIPLSAVPLDVGRALRVGPAVLPMTDDDVRTMVQTDQGEMAFQEYFVHRACEPSVHGFRFFGADAARPGPGVLQAIEAADLVIVCPSNPWVSIDPILAIPGVRQSVASRTAVAVSPLVGGKALKGPAAKMAAELGIEPTPASIAVHYRGVVEALVYDLAAPG